MDIIQLEKFFTPDLTAARIKRLRPSPKSPTLDLIYPEAKQDTYPKSRIPVEDLPSAVKNAPLIRRGAASYAMPQERSKVDGYEPIPVEITDTVSDAKLNDMRNLSEEGFQSWLDLRAQRMKDIVKSTVESLALQSLSGKLTGSVQLSPGVFDNYDVNFGNPHAFNAPKLFTAVDADITDVIEAASIASDKLGEKGFDSNVLGLCSPSAFKALVRICTLANTKNFQVTVTENAISFPGYTFKRFGARYYDYKTKTWIQGITDKKICFVGNDAPFWLPFLSLDNAEANFEPLPFWFAQKRDTNGKGFILTAESKPFPVPIVDALVWATVTA